ncbi:MAG TPA: hypothetical protein VGH33_18245, partial [Isosphaeraceae bacterium]
PIEAAGTSMAAGPDARGLGGLAWNFVNIPWLTDARYFGANALFGEIRAWMMTILTTARGEI